MPNRVDYSERLATFREALEALQNPAAPAQTKNKLLKDCIESIEYTREKPERLKRKPGEKRGTTLKVGGSWSTPPIELDVKLKIDFPTDRA